MTGLLSQAPTAKSNVNAGGASLSSATKHPGRIGAQYALAATPVATTGLVAFVRAARNFDYSGSRQTESLRTVSRVLAAADTLLTASGSRRGRDTLAPFAGEVSALLDLVHVGIGQRVVPLELIPTAAAAPGQWLSIGRLTRKLLFTVVVVGRAAFFAVRSSLPFESPVERDLRALRHHANTLFAVAYVPPPPPGATDALRQAWNIGMGDDATAAAQGDARPDAVATHPSMLSPLGKQQVRSGMRRCEAADVSFCGDPRLAPLATFEVAPLARLLARIETACERRLATCAGARVAAALRLPGRGLRAAADVRFWVQLLVLIAAARLGIGLRWALGVGAEAWSAMAAVMAAQDTAGMGPGSGGVRPAAL